MWKPCTPFMRFVHRKDEYYMYYYMYVLYFDVMNPKIVELTADVLQTFFQNTTLSRAFVESHDTEEGAQVK